MELAMSFTVTFICYHWMNMVVVNHIGHGNNGVTSVRTTHGTCISQPEQEPGANDFFWDDMKKSDEIFVR